MKQSRRKFIAQTLALGCSAAASPLVTPVTFASAPTDNRLVVIVLRGGMDALDVVAPIGDPLLRKYRPKLSKNGHIDLDGFFGLHPNMPELLPMWKAGELGFVHAVSTPYRNKRSHFDGQDLLEAGVSKVTHELRDSGWMNRMLSLIPGAKKDTAFSVGRESMLVLRGDAPITSWAPEGRLDLSPQAQLLLDAIYAKDPLFAEAGQTAMTLSAELAMKAIQSEDGDEEAMMSMGEKIKASAAAQRAGGLAAFSAARLKEETRFATFSIGGWDTHQKQHRSLRNGTRELQSALVTLKSELGPVWEKTTVLCMTEFGRTVHENGTGGTDHGTGGAMVLAGGTIKGRRIYGDWPGLDEADLFARRDLKPTGDLRRYVAWALHDLFGLSKADLQTTVFPNADLLHNPGFIR